MVVRILVLALVCCAPLHQASAYYSDEDSGSLEDLDSREVRPGYGRAAYNSGRNSRHKPPVYGPTPYNSGHSGCWRKELSQILAGSDIQGIGHRRVKKARNSLASHNTVKDQGTYSTCWAFSVLAVIERNIWKEFNQKVKLSEQYVVDCCRDCQTIDMESQVSRGGARIKAFNFLKTNGLVDLNSYPYEGPVGQCKPAPNLPYRLETIRTIPQSNEAGLVAELQRKPGHFIAIGIMIDEAFKRYIRENPTGIVPQTLCGTTGLTNHAVALVGYGEGYWEIRNSYGEGHANEGYFRMLRNGQNTCNENTQPAQAITVTDHMNVRYGVV